MLLEFSVNLGTVEVTITNLAGEVVYKLSVESKPLVIISLDKEVKEGDILSITDGMNIVYGKIDMNMWWIFNYILIVYYISIADFVKIIF